LFSISIPDKFTYHPKQFAPWNPMIDKNEDTLSDPTFDYNCAILRNISYRIGSASTTMGLSGGSSSSI